MKKILSLLIILCLTSSPISMAASPWAEKETYGGKVAGKLEFGLKNTLFGWMQMFQEAQNPKHKTEWEGFCLGIGQGAVYMVAGVVQLATFPIPVDFPDVGDGFWSGKGHQK